MRSHGMSAHRPRRLGRAERRIVRVTAVVDRRSWSLLRSRFSARPTKNRKRPVEAAGAVDAKNAPTAPWKTGRPVSHSYHRLFLRSLVTGKVSPMFPVNFVTYVPGCTPSHLSASCIALSTLATISVDTVSIWLLVTCTTQSPISRFVEEDSSDTAADEWPPLGAQGVSIERIERVRFDLGCSNSSGRPLETRSFSRTL